MGKIATVLTCDASRSVSFRHKSEFIKTAINTRNNAPELLIFRSQSLGSANYSHMAILTPKILVLVKFNGYTLNRRKIEVRYVEIGKFRPTYWCISETVQGRTVQDRTELQQNVNSIYRVLLFPVTESDI